MYRKPTESVSSLHNCVVNNKTLVKLGFQIFQIHPNVEFSSPEVDHSSGKVKKRSVRFMVIG